MFQDNSFRKIIIIARNTFREAIRDRVLYNLIAFVLLITASSVLLGDLTDGHEARTIVNLGLSAMLFFGAFIAIFVGVSLVFKEIEKRTVYAIFAKPISRSEFIIGKYLGLCSTLFANIIFMGIGISIALFSVKGDSLIVSAWGAIALIFIELTILTAIAILFSSFSTPALSALLTFLVFVIGHFSSSLHDFAAGVNSQAARILLRIIYYVLPNLSFFSFITNAAYGDIPSLSILAGGALYAVVYNVTVLAATIFVFSRRNFK